jgi:hypothetical protein
MKKLYTLLLMALFIVVGKSYAASVTSSTASVGVCTQSFTQIANIVIAESGPAGDFGTATATTGNYFILAAPNGFLFDPSAGVTANFAGGGNASGAAVVSVTNYEIVITYNCDANAPAKNDVLTIGGIKVQATTVSGTVGNITLGYGSSVIGGGPNNGNTLASVQSALSSISYNPSPSVNCTSDATYTLSGGSNSTAAGAGVSGVSYTGGAEITNPFPGTYHFHPSAGAGLYPVTYNVSTNSPSCVFSTTSDIVVNASPTVTMVVTETSGKNNNDNIICNGDNVTFTGSGANSYKFYDVSGPTLLSSSNPFTSNSITNGQTVYVQGTDANNCQSNSSNQSITVNPIPTNPTFNPTHTTFSTSSPAFQLDTLDGGPSPAIGSTPSFFSGPGVQFQNGHYYFYPDVASNSGSSGPYTITYTYVNPSTYCESNTQISITVSGGVTAGSILGIKSKFCIYDPVDTISITYCPGIFQYYEGMQYSTNGGASWTDLSLLSATNPVACTYGTQFTYNYLIYPSTLGVGIVLFRYYYYDYFFSLFGFGGSSLVYSSAQSTTVYGRPNISITNAFNSVSCTNQAPTILTYSLGGGSGTPTFSSPTPNFVQFNNADNLYYVHWNNGSSTYTATMDSIKMNFTDVVTGCSNSTEQAVYVALQPAKPTAYPGYPLVFCNTDYTYGFASASPGYTMQWIKNDSISSPTYSDNFYPNYNESYYPIGVIASSQVYYLKQYIYPGCVSYASAPYNITVNTPVTIKIGQYSNVCSNQTIDLNQYQKSGPAVTQTWSTITSSPGSFNNNTSNSPIYTLSAADIARGYVSFQVLTSDPDGPEGCPAVAKDTTVYINLLPTITASTPLPVYCSNNSISLNSSLNNAAAYPVTWYKSAIGGSQAGITSPTLPSTAFVPNALEKAGGALTFFVQSSDPDGPGPCTTVNTSVSFTINPEAVVNAGSPITTCGSSAINLSGTCTKFGGAALAATWTGGSGGSYAPNNTTLITAYTPTVAESNGTSIMFTLTSADPDGAGPCLAGSSAITDVINQAPTIYAGPNMTYCSSSIPTLTATLGGSATGITWSRIGVGGTINSPNNATTTYTYQTSEKSGATITFIATSNDPDGAGPCVPATSQVAITVNPEALVNAGLPITTCGSSNVPLSGTCITFGGNPLGATWSGGAGSYSPNATSLSTNYIPTLTEANGGQFTYILTSNDPDGAGPCPVITSSVTNTINQAPFVNAGPNASWCTNTTPVITGVLSGSATQITWTKNSGSGIITSPNSLSTDYLVSAGDYASGKALSIIFTATTNDPDGTGPNGPCVPAVSNVTITLSPNLTVNAGTDMAFCGHTLIPNGFKVLVNTADIKIGGAERDSAGVNSWSVYAGAGTLSGINFTSNFHVDYTPSGVLADSGTVISTGSGEFGNLSVVTLMLKSNDPDGAGPCLADSDFVNLTVYPRPITHFSGFQTEYCKNTPAFNLIGYGNLGSTISGNAKFSVLAGANNSINTSGDFYIFNPSDPSISGNGAIFKVEYKQKDNNGCYNFVDTTVNVYPIPKIGFTTSSRCQYDTVTFTQAASVNNSVFPASADIRWDWYLDGDSVQNTLPPTTYSTNTPSTQYSFSNYGNHSVKLVVTSNSGGTLNCINKLDTTLIFGPYPVTNYTWSRPCSVDSVFFVNGTTIPAGYSNGISWNMNGAGAYKSGTSNISANPNYKFSQPGIYNVALTATTNIYNCKKVKNKQVYVVPTYNVTPGNPYDSSFAKSNLKWAPSSANPDSSYSWQYGIPSGKQVITSPNNLWVTNLTGNYKIGELSYLNSPCFNFQTLDKPMIVLNMWSNTGNLAGAVLEATTGNTNPWVTIGQIGQGINWYNTSGVVGLIGESPSNPIAQGFSGELDSMVLSRIGLSQYASQNNLVRFRITFGSSNVIDPLNEKDGIAIDSVWIGNRSKVVLMEHFTNSLCPTCIEANDTVNSIQTNRPSDVVSIQYHTSFPGVDNMNLKDPSDPSSRVLYYGISSTPRTYLDGTQLYSSYNSAPGSLQLSDIDNLALQNSAFSLDMSTTKVGLDLTVKTQMVAKQPLSQDVTLNVAVLEKYVSGTIVGGNQSGYQYVLKKMLPDASGNYISKNWKIGDTLKTVQNWNFNLSDFYDTSQIEVVAFIQNFASRQVYQAAKVSSSGNTSVPIITAVQTQDIADNLLIYPVPADNEVNILFANDLTSETSYSLSDDIGKVVEKGTMDIGVRMLTFNTKKLAAGMYYLVITKQDGSKLNRKIIVIH